MKQLIKGSFEVEFDDDNPYDSMKGAGDALAKTLKTSYGEDMVKCTMKVEDMTTEIKPINAEPTAKVVMSVGDYADKLADIDDALVEIRDATDSKKTCNQIQHVRDLITVAKGFYRND